MTLFLNAPLPDASVSLSVFFALSPFSDFRFIGSVNDASPSTSVRLRLQAGHGQPTALHIAVLTEASAATEQRSAQLQACFVADDLFTPFLNVVEGNEFSVSSGVVLRWISSDFANRFS